MSVDLPLRPADPAEVADAFAYALLYDGKQRVRHADGIMARISGDTDPAPGAGWVRPDARPTRCGADDVEHAVLDRLKTEARVTDPALPSAGIDIVVSDLPRGDCYKLESLCCKIKISALFNKIDTIYPPYERLIATGAGEFLLRSHRCGYAGGMPSAATRPTAPTN